MIINDLDRHLLTYIAWGVPFVSHPFEELGKPLGLDEAETLLRVSKLKAGAFFSGIYGVFDARRLGYLTSLVAMAVPDRAEEKLAQLLCFHPGVVEGFLADYPLNMWLRVAVPGERVLYRHVRQIRRVVKAKQCLILKLLKIYKTASNSPAILPAKGGKAMAFLPEEIDVVRTLQNDLPLMERPFAKMAAALGLKENRFLEVVTSLWRRRILLRIRAVLFDGGGDVLQTKQRHVFLKVPEERLEVVGRKLLACSELLAAYRRRASWRFPYTLHLVFRSGVEGDRISDPWKQIVGPWPAVVFETREHRCRRRLGYFSEGLESWWLGKGSTEAQMLLQQR